ncbi:uridine phosphorylase, partial [Halobacteriales archaeon SW_7_71_33]
MLEELRRAGVQDVEMEAAAVLTLAAIFDLRARAVCTVYADRDTGEFAAEGQTAAAETASLP